MKTNLTDVSIRALTPPLQGQLTIWDKTSPLGVRVSQGGSKTFVLMIGSGKRRTLGRFGIVTLSKAREEARRIVAQKTLRITVPVVRVGVLFDVAVRLSSKITTRLGSPGQNTKRTACSRRSFHCSVRNCSRR